MKNSNQNKPDFCNFLVFDKDRKKCIDKIETISWVHNTGHITVITKSGKEHKTTLTSLISELKTNQVNEIVRHGNTIFENFMRFRYTEKRSDEFDKIIQRAKLKFIDMIEQPDIFKNTNSFVVTVQIDNVNLDLAEFIQHDKK